MTFDLRPFRGAQILLLAYAERCLSRADVALFGSDRRLLDADAGLAYADFTLSRADRALTRADHALLCADRRHRLPDLPHLGEHGCVVNHVFLAVEAEPEQVFTAGPQAARALDVLARAGHGRVVAMHEDERHFRLALRRCRRLCLAGGRAHGRCDRVR